VAAAHVLLEQPASCRSCLYKGSQQVIWKSIACSAIQPGSAMAPRPLRKAGHLEKSSLRLLMLEPQLRQLQLLSCSLRSIRKDELLNTSRNGAVPWEPSVCRLGSLLKRSCNKPGIDRAGAAGDTQDVCVGRLQALLGRRFCSILVIPVLPHNRYSEERYECRNRINWAGLSC
jgi:hypothetical protein